MLFNAFFKKNVIFHEKVWSKEENTSYSISLTDLLKQKPSD